MVGQTLLSFPHTCSSVTQEQCQYDMLDHLAKNSLSGRPASGAGSGASAGRSGGRGTGVEGGASPHRHVRIFWTFPFMGGHCKDMCVEPFLSKNYRTRLLTFS